MPPRLATRPARENDFSNVGKVGRRTGVTLPQGRLDINGIEEISGIFSSPRKPSPLKQSITIVESVEENVDATPKQAKSTRKSLPPPRSASPRKSGISGTARRSKNIDVFNQNQQKEVAAEEAIEIENRPVLTPSLLASGARRFSPEKTPLKDVSQSGQNSTRSSRREILPSVESLHESVEINREIPVEMYEESELQAPEETTQTAEDEYILPATGDDDDQVSIAASVDDNFDEPALPAEFDDEEADQTFEPESRAKTRSREPTIANSRRKRKSDAIEQDMDVEAISSPAAKRAKRISDQSSKSKPIRKSPEAVPADPVVPKPRGRPPLKNKSNNIKMSTKQQNELDNIIEKVKARPDQKKSLYVLKRETPAEDGVTHTRSGRISVKPLAYWRNERCVYGGSPGGASLEDGARFPLNSIKEIIRLEEMEEQPGKKSKKTSKASGKRPQRSQTTPIYDDSEEEPDEEYEDPDAEPWETERGIYKGNVSIWDPQHQTITEREEEIDIAYAPASIVTREVKDSTFRYAKLLSLKFLGSGIVDLPPGGVKKSKNSRRMHMSFFVASGRVTVSVGPMYGPENKFSIGKGGWWQVPRGNQYYIENELSKAAKIFFSQACDMSSVGDND